MFGQVYFADRYFPGRYFPHVGGGLVKPRYFYHGFFSANYFADRYFPGNPVNVVPPTPTPVQVIGGPARAPEPELIEARLRLRIPVPVVDLAGEVIPTDAAGGMESQIPVPLAQVGAQTVMAGSLVISLASADLRPAGLVMAPRRKAVNEDAELQAHYWLSLK